MRIFRAFSITSNAFFTFGFGRTRMPASRNDWTAAATLVLAAFTRRNTGARCCIARMTASKSGPRLSRNGVSSQSGQSSAARPCAGAPSSSGPGTAGAWPMPVNNAAMSSPAARAPPSTRPRPLRPPPKAANDRLQRSASNTRSRNADRSPEPANRLDRPQLVSTCSAFCPARMRSSTSIAADNRAAGVIRSTPPEPSG